MTAYVRRFVVFSLSAVLVGSLAMAFVVSAQDENGSPPAADGISSSTLSLREELQLQIEARGKELEKINKEIAETQKNLSETKTERVSLQKELDRLQYTSNQLRLSIQSDEIVVQKLNLEIQSLTFDIQDTESAIKDKRSAITKILRELQKHSDTNLMFIFLKSNSLADSIFEAQSLNDLNAKLVVDVSNLRGLNESLSQKLKESDDKRKETTYHQRNLENKKLIVLDQKKEQQIILDQTKNKESVYEKQIAELRKLQQQIADEIETIDAELRSKIDLSLLPSTRPGVLGLPLEGIPVVTQRYGSTDFSKTAYQGKLHNGLDFRAAVGTPVLAAEDGSVVAVGDQDTYKGCYRGAYGKFIVINHNNNLTTLYAHLSRYIVSKGSAVKRGDVIGYSGSTGYATGPHLHLTVFAQPTFYMGQSRVCGSMPFGGDLNPAGYLNLSASTSTARL